MPQPDLPMTPTVSPGSIEKSMPSTALTQAICRRGNSAVVTGKCFVSPSISSSGCGMAVLRAVISGWAPENGSRDVRCVAFGEPAPRRPGFGDRHLGRLFRRTLRQRIGTARVEGAARRQGREIGRLARDREQLFLAAELRHRAEQRLRVGVPAAVEQLRTLPASTILPAYITASLSHMRATIPRLCVTKMIATPVCSCNSRSRSRYCAWIVTSRLVVGSSAMISFGPPASAIAPTMRCRMPPDI